MTKLIGFDYSPLRGGRGPGLDDLILEDVKLQPLEVSPDGKRQLIRVFNEDLPEEYDWYEDIWYDMADGEAPLPQDCSRLWVIQRYADGKRHVISTFTKDYVVTKGAFAITNQSPAPYIAVVGRDEADMLAVAKRVDEVTGCYAACEDGKIIGVLDLPLAGAISDLNAEEFVRRAGALAALGKQGGFVDDMGWFRQLMMLFWKLDRNQKLVY